MNTQRALRFSLINAGLESVPPQIRELIQNDSSFVRDLGLSTELVSKFGDDGPLVNGSALHAAISKSISDGVCVSVADQTGVEWTIQCLGEGDDLKCQVAAGNHCFVIENVSPLASLASRRIAWFDQASQRYNFPSDRVSHWKRVLERSPLMSEEYSDLMEEIGRSPVAIFEELERVLEKRRVSLDDLIPSNPSYYQELAGALSGETVAREFVERSSACAVNEMLKRDVDLGLKFGLLRDTSPWFAASLELPAIEEQALESALDWCVANGDPISFIALVELAFRSISVYPSIQDAIDRAIRCFLVDSSDRDRIFSRFGSLLVLALSELQRRRLFAGTPPFYRRHVAFAHAGILLRAFRNWSDSEWASIERWIASVGIPVRFLTVGLVSLRCEPRWLPEYADGAQLLAEVIGRIRIAAEASREAITVPALQELVLGSESLLGTLSPWPRPFLSGPMEGALEYAQELPSENWEKIEGSLNADQLSVESFAAFNTFGLVFLVPLQLANMAASALRRVSFAVETPHDERSAFGLAGGLAITAASSRSTELASALRILVRVLRRRNRLNAHPVDELRIALFAAASHENVDDWAKFAGEWISEIAFELDDKKRAGAYLFHIRELTKVEPRLAKWCSAAEAAVESFALM